MNYLKSIPERIRSCKRICTPAIVNYLKSIPERIVLFTVPIACLLADIVAGSYLIVTVRNYDYFESLLSKYVNHYYDIDFMFIDDRTKQQLFEQTQFLCFVGLILVIGFHLAMYFFYIKKKEVSRKYLLTLTFIISLSLFLYSIQSLLNQSWFIFLIFLLPSLIYAAVFFLAKRLIFHPHIRDNKEDLESAPNLQDKFRT